MPPPLPHPTIRAAALRLGVSPSTLTRWIDRGIIRAERLPTGIRRPVAASVEEVAETMGREGVRALRR